MNKISFITDVWIGMISPVFKVTSTDHPSIWYEFCVIRVCRHNPGFAASGSDGSKSPPCTSSQGTWHNMGMFENTVVL